ncbi:hypothetical protein pdam_00001039 [Pocillopora damicornis]|uniref:Uncharacterized protein n=2 Tax=Pocillopora TaxID=46730 RepID=A0A3M6T646_POCDA|nr:hypothetical protein pdam_00001039 [Pocillopora damicornis]CAH3120205.1 unnamed protein product [Pocillopora meandrina]
MLNSEKTNFELFQETKKGTARDLFKGYDGTEKDSLMQTEIVLREKLETLKRLDDMILDFLLPHPRPSPCFWPSIAPLDSDKVKAEIRGAVLAIEEKLK